MTKNQLEHLYAIVEWLRTFRQNPAETANQAKVTPELGELLADLPETMTETNKGIEKQITPQNTTTGRLPARQDKYDGLLEDLPEAGGLLYASAIKRGGWCVVTTDQGKEFRFRNPNSYQTPQ